MSRISDHPLLKTHRPTGDLRPRYIYVAKVKRAKELKYPIKIGVAVDPKKRLRDIRGSIKRGGGPIPEDLSSRLMLVEAFECPGAGFDYEKRIFNILDNYRVEREWFQVSTVTAISVITQVLEEAERNNTVPFTDTDAARYWKKRAEFWERRASKFERLWKESVINEDPLG